MATILYRDVARQIQMQSNLLANDHAQTDLIDLIIDECCFAYGVSHEQLESKTRRREVVVCRQAAIWIAARQTTMTLKNIGEKMGSQHYSTVIHSRDTMEELIWQKNHAGKIATIVDEKISEILKRKK